MNSLTNIWALQKHKNTFLFCYPLYPFFAYLQQKKDAVASTNPKKNS